MLTRKKSIVLCFVIGALLCTLISYGKMDGTSAGEAMTMAFVPEGLPAEEIDIRKTSREENTREFLKAAIKSTESDSRPDQENSPEAVAMRIAEASLVGGIADYGITVQSGQTASVNGVQTKSLQAETEKAEPEAAVAPELENKVVTTVVDSYLNIRQEPSEDSEIVGRLYEGGAGEVLETAEGWTKISSGDVEGWVHNEYVVSDEEAQSFAEESLRQVVTITEEGVRVRAEASLDAPWIGMVDLNETYRVVPEEVPEVETEAETEQETESAETPEVPEASVETEVPAEAETPEESSEAFGQNGEMPVSLEALVGAEALVVPEAGESDEPETAEVQSEETQAESESGWVRIIYDDDQEGYVCTDYVTVSFVLGKAKSIEEIRAEEEAAARAAAEKAAAEKAEREKAAAKTPASTEDTSAGSGWVSLGEFKITAYCGGECCNGQWAGTTASGAVPAEGRTIAVAPGLIPYGTRVKIAGMDGVYVAEDTGGFANGNPRQIDVYYADHARATSRGVSYREIWVQR